MTDINSVILIGNLTRDCELKYMQSGSAIATFSLAVNQTYVSNGQKTDNVYYFDIAVFGKMAESLSQYLTKGKKVAVSGHLKQDRWQDNQGQNKSKVSIVAESLELLSPMDHQNTQQQQFPPQQNQSQYAQQFAQQQFPPQNPQQDFGMEIF